MKLLRRKRLRWLRRWLFRPPQLVIPATVIGAYPNEIEYMWVNEPHADEFVWGHEMAPNARLGRRGLRLTAPSDAEWAQRYKELTCGHVTYEPKTAQARLLACIATKRGKSPKFVIEPTSN